MVPFQESRPLPADLILRKVVMRFMKDRAVPLVDDWGGCVGIVHRDDCTKVCCAVSFNRCQQDIIDPCTQANETFGTVFSDRDHDMTNLRV
jgi:hypothetical protein